MVRCGHSIRVKIQLIFYLVTFTVTGKISPKELQKRHEKLLIIFQFYWVIFNNNLIYNLLILFISGYLPIYLFFNQYVLEKQGEFFLVAHEGFTSHVSQQIPGTPSTTSILQIGQLSSSFTVSLG